MNQERVAPANPSHQPRPRREHRCFFLLASLLALILLYPFVQLGPGATIVVLVLNSATLVAGTYAISDSRRHFVIALSIAVPQVLSAVAATAAGPGQFLAVSSLGLIILFYSYTLVQVLKYIFRGKVTSDKLFGAAAAYLLLGLAFASLYVLIDEIQPGAFAMGGGQGAVSFSAFVYFSFATLTTLGYGDITPLTDIPRSIAALEAVGGVLYMAFLVSRLVSLYHAGGDADG